ncbi:DMT family transporter [Prevotella dentasini]|uniref:DMT family transporter n=1 Tax=Prevotella dentasini TaxID=589537 RepID=UPI00278BF238|nr:DMT family transporter [Prevotella dentasini]
MMHYLGEIISLGVAFSWTIAAMSCEVASKRLGVVVTNVWRMGLALVLSLLLMWWFTGDALPVHATYDTWLWLSLSGVVGYFLCDWCLFNSYLVIGSRYGQLFMTLAPVFTAFCAWVMMGQKMNFISLIAMIVTISGIAISVLSKGDGKHKVALQLPLKGVLLGIGAGMGQGVGYVLSLIGQEYYKADVQAVVSESDWQGMEGYMPFGANLIRCVAGLLCWSIWLILKGDGPRWAGSVKNLKGMLAMVVAVLSGPFIGVSFSLMAGEYTNPGIASTLMATSPIMILLPAHYFFHEKITLKGVVGAVISVVGVSLFFI